VSGTGSGVGAGGGSGAGMHAKRKINAITSKTPAILILHIL